MARVRRAVHRTILVVDVEGYGDWRRSGENQVAVRDGVYQVLHSAFDDVGIRWHACKHEDRGDGLFVLAPSTIQKGLFSESFPLVLADRLRAHNKTHEPEENIRLRMALHAGEINYDDHGVAGTAINHAFRLVDAAQLKAALRSSPGTLAVIASSWFYGEVIRQSRECRPDSYLPVMVNEKETTAIGWVALPDHPAPPARDVSHETWRVRILDSDGRIHGNGVLMHGRYVITAASVIERSLARRTGSRPRAAQILLDLPKRPQVSVRQAEIIWRPPGPAGRAGDLTGLSIIGPAIRGVNEPPLRRVGLSYPRIIRVHRFVAIDNRPTEVKAWGRLSGYNTDAHDPVPLNSIADFGPHVTHECSGADVIDAETGGVLGIAQMIPQSGERAASGMASVESIAAQWPLLGRIVTASERDSHGAEPVTRTSQPTQELVASGSTLLQHTDFMRLIDRCLEVPELATSQSRHVMVSELPLEIALAAPRSSIDRADLAALLWTYAKTPRMLAEFRDQVQKKTRSGNACRELLKDLDRILLS